MGDLKINMSDLNLSMGDGERSGGFLAYGIPHPPKYPDTLMLEGKEVATILPKHGRRFGVRRNSRGNGYDVRQFNLDDPKGKGKFDEHDWDLEFRFGAPSAYIGWTPLAIKWGLRALEDAGYINFENGVSSVRTKPIGRFAPKRKGDSESERIHPIFRMAMWQSITDEQFQAITPALLLATALLDDPTTLNLFHAVSVPYNELVTFEDPVHGYCRRAVIPDTLDEDQQWAAHEKILAMRNWTSFCFDESADFAKGKVFAVTEPVYDNGKPVIAARPLTCRSTIHLAPAFRKAMSSFDHETSTGSKDYELFFKNTLDKADVNEAFRPTKIDLLSAAKRTTLIMASTLIHEFAHAFSMAYYQRVAYPRTPFEPWFGDNRSNEIGFATVAYILGYVPHSNCFATYSTEPEALLEQVIYAPFGIYFHEKWDRWRQTNVNEQVLLNNAAEDAKMPQVIYPLPQQYVYELESEKMWKTEVPRYGLRALKLPKLSEWAVEKMPRSPPRIPLPNPPGMTVRFDE